MKYCQWCDSLFESNVSYQIYCSPECRSEATKQKIVERYQEKRRTSRKPRNCKSCGTQLSMYNDDPLCANCEINPSDVNKILKEIKSLSRKKDKDK